MEENIDRMINRSEKMDDLCLGSKSIQLKSVGYEKKSLSKGGFLSGIFKGGNVRS